MRDLNLSFSDREFLCILGPSGAENRPTLRMLAGLEVISVGRSSGRWKTHQRCAGPRPRHGDGFRELRALSPSRRLSQHFDAARGAKGCDEIRRRVAEVAEVLHLADQLHQRPRTLSGGQRQRVALGRALIRRPSIFLMDEPLGHLEAYMRVELRSEIRRLHEERRTTTVYITHDQEEAGAVADRIAVMNAVNCSRSAALSTDRQTR